MHYSEIHGRADEDGERTNDDVSYADVLVYWGVLWGDGRGWGFVGERWGFVCGRVGFVGEGGGFVRGGGVYCGRGGVLCGGVGFCG